MTYVDLTSHNHNLRKHPVAKRINEIMHDSMDNSCINFLDKKTLLNRLESVDPDQFKDAIHYLIKHRYLDVQTYHGQKFYSLGSR